RAGLGDAADIIAPKIEQHQMLGAFLWIHHQFRGKLLVFFDRLSTRPRAGNGPDRYGVVSQAHEDFRTRTNDGESWKVQEIQEWRRIEPPQGAIKRQRRQREGAAETLARHDLEN